MMGREAGTRGHDKATDYLAAELRALGLQPAGENGTFFQTVPLVRRTLDETSPLSVNGTPLTAWEDYALVDPRRPVHSLAGVQVVYGGTFGDMGNVISREDAAGKLVVFSNPPGMMGINPGAVGDRLMDAAGVAVTGIGPLLDQYTDYLRTPSVNTPEADQTPIPATLLLPSTTVPKVFGKPAVELEPGTVGGTIEGEIRYREEPAPSRNVVAVLPGSDPALRGQYVAFGAHSDHDGLARMAMDHDSLRAANIRIRQLEEQSGGMPLSPDARESVRVNTDSLRGLAPVRRDSVFNGADDDASGSVALLEIAQEFAAMNPRPRRSTLFVWHTAEEKGLVGAQFFTENPTLPLDSIVANINIDMIGRGGEADLAGGGADYLQLLGSRRLSTELGDIVEAVNQERPQPFRFDYTFDAPGHPENYYCRSDHAMYARFGIPIVFFTTGDHVDYHQLTDEPQYIDYQKLESVTDFISEVGLRIANLDHRLVVDQPKPDPNAPCQQ